jgi:quercetin dioxygenase-like cupin family protein
MPEGPLPKNPLDPTRASVRNALFGGTGAVRVWDLGATTPPFTAVLYCELDPGGRVGEHVQEADQEVVIVVAGEAVLYVDGRARASVPGDAVALPLGSRLSIDNASPTDPVRYVIVKARDDLG